MRALVLVAVLLGACGSDESIGTGGRSTEATINAFALGYFAGLTVSASDYIVGGLMTNGQREAARADRREHGTADWLGKALGFATLVAGGWKLYGRRGEA